MTKYLSLFLHVSLICLSLTLQSQEWHPAGEKIKTPWTEKIDPANPLPEYPRPILQRDEWQNLNGLWDYAVLPKGSAVPGKYDGKILVPFAVESSLSGVMKTVGPENELWYHREFSVPSSWNSRQIVLNFGAVDWKTDVWINDIKIGSHQGGYAPFSFDITPFLEKAGSQKLVVRVWDPTDKSNQPRGKQVSDPRGIWYTAVTGIWQTVWLEPVGITHITGLRTVPNIDRNTVSVVAYASRTDVSSMVEIRVIDQRKVIATGRSVVGQEVLLGLTNIQLWCPENPKLYDLEAILLVGGKPVDRVKSYFGMRKISTKRDAGGIYRLQLNNRDYFQFGPLDQGWWPDGLYTAPADEALKYDIVKTKELGFNLIRKHVKVEPARWYYHCDREGILVWQDMPSGDRGPQWQTRQFFNGQEAVRSKQSEENFLTEWKAIIDMLISNPCVVTWVPFNESWGQFKTVEIAEWTKNYDPSRLVNPASGGNFYPVGDMLDIHHYPDPEMTLYDGSRACVLGEYGGLGLALPDHLWVEERNWGYVEYKNADELTNAYIEQAEKLKKLITSGFSAAIYTQTTDVEIEVNGLITYDRKVIKPDQERVRKVNVEICKSLAGN
jgi:beta-galactosidase/beta-glucuronidase